VTKISRLIVVLQYLLVVDGRRRVAPAVTRREANSAASLFLILWAIGCFAGIPLGFGYPSLNVAAALLLLLIAAWVYLACPVPASDAAESVESP
jgi:hypothetical protein